MITFRHRDMCTAALLGVLLLGVVLTAAGCGDVPGDSEDTGSILKAIVTPYYLEKITNQVDSQMDECKTGEEIKEEEFSDHYAKIGFINQSLPNSTEETGTSVRLRAYRIEYQGVSASQATVNEEDGTTKVIPADAPHLDPVLNPPLTSTVVIPQCKAGTLDCKPTEYDGFTFVSVAKKAEYVSKADMDLIQSQYNIFYTFYAENDFGEDVSFGASSNFLIANYNNCPSGQGQ